MTRFDRTPSPFSSRWPAVVLMALIAAVGPGLAACSSVDESGDIDEIDSYGVEGPFEPDGPGGKADNAGVPGPRVNNDTRATQVWDATEKWENTDSVRAREAGMAWPANSGLTWDEKYSAWVESMTRTASVSYFETFTLTTPWGKTLPAPKLECAELAMFLRITFAAWYNLPFYLTSTDASGTRLYFGHFGARTASAKYKNTPNYGYSYKDHSKMSAAELAQGWPQDASLRSKGLYGGGDEMDFLFEGARAGAYFDEVHLNKRVGHFTLLTLAYFGSMHLASSRNTYNLRPDAVSAGDVLVERWQRNGIGHVLVVKSVNELAEGGLEANLVSGSMPRRQPKWEDGVASKHYFTLAETGGEGQNSDGELYVKLGGGLKRFRVTKNVNGYWTNTWMAGDEASWINDTDYATLAARPGQFDNLLGEVSPEQKREALIGIIEDARNHLRQYPASCSARIKREDAFELLYELNEREFGTSRAQTDSAYRTLEDYAFAKLEYTASKTCCWNSTTAAMYQIVMDYNESLQANACTEPVVFKCTGGGYNVFKQFAEATGRGHLWVAWSEDESCPQRNVVDDTIVDTTEVNFCDIDPEAGGGSSSGGACVDDAYEDNDSPASATALSGGNHGGLMVCSGDDDHYKLTVPAGSSLSVSIAFSHAQGDLDIALYRGTERVAASESVGNSETVQVSQAGTYTLRVYGYNGAQASYSLSATVN